MAELTGGAIWPRPGIDILATSFGVWRGVGRKIGGVGMEVGVEVEAWSLELMKLLLLRQATHRELGLCIPTVSCTVYPSEP